MEYIATYHTDVGTRKETNQDSLAIKVVNTKREMLHLQSCVMAWEDSQKAEVASKRGNRSILYMV